MAEHWVVYLLWLEITQNVIGSERLHSPAVLPWTTIVCSSTSKPHHSGPNSHRQTSCSCTAWSTIAKTVLSSAPCSPWTCRGDGRATLASSMSLLAGWTQCWTAHLSGFRKLATFSFSNIHGLIFSTHLRLSDVKPSVMHAVYLHLQAESVQYATFSGMWYVTRVYLASY